jgi:hypothetical protein
MHPSRLACSVPQRGPGLYALRMVSRLLKAALGAAVAGLGLFLYLLLVAATGQSWLLLVLLGLVWVAIWWCAWRLWELWFR